MEIDLKEILFKETYKELLLYAALMELNVEEVVGVAVEKFMEGRIVKIDPARKDKWV